MAIVHVIKHKCINCINWSWNVTRTVFTRRQSAYFESWFEIRYFGPCVRQITSRFVIWDAHLKSRSRGVFELHVRISNHESRRDLAYTRSKIPYFESWFKMRISNHDSNHDSKYALCCRVKTVLSGCGIFLPVLLQPHVHDLNSRHTWKTGWGGDTGRCPKSSPIWGHMCVTTRLSGMQLALAVDMRLSIIYSLLTLFMFIHNLSDFSCHVPTNCGAERAQVLSKSTSNRVFRLKEHLVL